MDIVCEKRQNTIKIPDEKVPKGKAFAINCPKCKNKISVNPAADPPPSPAKAPSAPPPPPKAQDGEDSESDNGGPGGGFEYLKAGTETALLCESNTDFHAKFKAALESMGYKVLSAQEPREALKQLRLHDFDVVLLDEMFGTRNPDVNHVHKHLSQLPMSTRRNIFVALISESFKTGDNMQTFNKSVNFILNTADIDRAKNILTRSINDNNAFYRVFKESVVKIKG